MTLLFLALLPSCVECSHDDHHDETETTETTDTSATDTDTETETDTDTETGTDTDTATTGTEPTDTATTGTEPELTPTEGPYELFYREASAETCGVDFGFQPGDFVQAFEITLVQTGFIFVNEGPDFECTWVDGSATEFTCPMDEYTVNETEDGHPDADFIIDVEGYGEWLSVSHLDFSTRFDRMCEGSGCAAAIADTGREDCSHSVGYDGLLNEE